MRTSSERRIAGALLVPLLLAGAMGTGAQSTAGVTASELWTRCAPRLAADAEAVPRTRRFGETDEMTQRLLPLVLDGEKTITTTSPWLYEHDPESRPVEGGYSIVLDERGLARAVLRTTSVHTLPFDEVTEEFSRYEGKPVRPIEAWREVHVRYFTRKLAPLGRTLAADMPVTLERFEVVCRAEE